MNPVTQDGVSASTTAAVVRSLAIRSAVLPRVQPNQEKPMIMVATAPTTTPHAAGLNHGSCSCMWHLFDCRSEKGTAALLPGPAEAVRGRAVSHEHTLTPVAPTESL